MFFPFKAISFPCKAPFLSLIRCVIFHKELQMTGLSFISEINFDYHFLTCLQIYLLLTFALISSLLFWLTGLGLHGEAENLTGPG